MAVFLLKMPFDYAAQKRAAPLGAKGVDYNFPQWKNSFTKPRPYLTFISQGGR
jgi:hypothetical protein